MEILGEIIHQMSKDESGNRNQIQLSEALDRKLKTVRESLSADLFELNRDVFKILAENKLT